MIVIPAIDLQGGKVVRLLQGRENDSSVYNADPLQVAKQWLDLAIERLHVIDLDGAFSGNSAHETVIVKIAAACRARGVALQVGGGIRTRAAVQRLLEAGVDQVILSTVLFEEEDFLREASRHFPQRLMVSLDVRDEEVHFRGWKAGTGRTLENVLKDFSANGLEDCFALVITDIKRDGMLQGPNLQLLKKVSALSSVPIILAGGVSALADIENLQKNFPKLFGVVTGKAIYEGKLDLAQALALTTGKKN